MSIILHMLNDPKVLSVVLGILGTFLNSLAIQNHWADTTKGFAAGGMALALAAITGFTSGKFTGSISDVGPWLTFGALTFSSAHGLYLTIQAAFPSKPLSKLQEATSLKKTTQPLPPT